MGDFINRRDFLKRTGTASLGLGLASYAGSAAKAVAQDACDKLGWQLAVHAYTFKNFSIFECMDKTASLGLKYMSLSGSVNLDGKKSVKTVDLSDADLQRIIEKAKGAGLKLVNIGVVQLPATEAESRKVFEFARKAGIDTLVAEPPDDALALVEKLCNEYKIKVAIHDHPKPSHYWNPDSVLAAVKDRTPLMGACADTGHWLRSGLDPVECLKKLEGRVICLHFKDLVPAAAANPGADKAESRAMHDVPWGTGMSNVRGQMAELKRQHFHGAFCVEYEYHWDNSLPEIAQCVRWFNKTAAELAT
jgi:sugar phosphate isomerase/epimerase